MFEIKWSEDIEPELTEEQKEEYSDLGLSQVYPIGNLVDNRRMFHGLGTKETIDSMLEFISFKNPLVIEVQDKEGIQFGFKKILVTEATEEIEAVYEVIRDEELTPYEKEDETDFFVPVDSKDEEGNDIEINIPEHKFAGWK